MRAILWAMAFMAVPAQAEIDEIGNGGNVILCPVPIPEMNGRSIFLQDHLEGRQLGLPLDLGPADLSAEEKAGRVLARLQRLDPVRAERYAEHLRQFGQDAQIAPNLGFPHLPDFGVVRYPAAGCTIEQAAFQREPILPFHRRYNIRAELWDRLDADARAGLMLHEIIFREAKGHGHRSADRVRYFNALLTANAFAGMTVPEYGAFVEDTLGLPVVTPFRNGTQISARTVKTDAGGQIVAGVLAQGTLSVAGGANIFTLGAGSEVALSTDGRFTRVGKASLPGRFCIAPNACQPFSAQLDWVEFTEQGEVHTMHGMVSGQQLPLRRCDGSLFAVTLLGRQTLTFHANGNWTGGYALPSPDGAQPRTGHGEPVAFAGDEPVVFDACGNVRHAKLSVGQAIPHPNGGRALAEAGAVVDLDERGFLVRLTR